MRTIKWMLLLVVGFCELLNAQPLTQVPTQPQQVTASKAERTMLVRGQEAIVQELIMGPEATVLWRKIQRLIAAPEIKDLSKLIDIFNLKITEPIDLIDWRKPGSAHRNDIASTSWFIASGSYGVFDQTATLKRKVLYLELKFNINDFCLTKQEIQRQYETGWEVAAFHSPQYFWNDKTGADHGFPLTNAKASFRVSAGGCITEYTANQILENTNEGANK